MRQLNCILLVDDNPGDNRLNRDLIRKVGCARHIEVAVDGEQALNYLSCSAQYADQQFFPSPELILLDLYMPGMNGWEFLEAHAKLPPEQRAKHVITMLTSAPESIGSKALGGTYSVSGVMHKPLTLEQLRGVLSRCWPDLAASVRP